MKIGIEDFCEDIVGKAMRGTSTSDSELAETAKVSSEAIQRLRRGEGDEATVRAVAAPLGLNADRLADSLNSAWYPEAHSVEGLFMTNTAYGDMFVNAFLVWDSEAREGAFFDTGADASALLAKAEEESLAIKYLFLTHTHLDHIADLESVQKAFPHAIICVGEREPLPGARLVKHGDEFQIGKLTVSTRLTWGHAEGGITYVVKGLESPVAVVGDAVFAGSMGGGKVSYEAALRTNREEILTLSDDTVLCPGHGPLTSVGEEKAHNPFF